MSQELYDPKRDEGDTASAALTNLFTAQEGNYSLDLAIDPTLSGAGSAAGDGSAAGHGTDGDSDAAGGPHRTKRTGTSRQNMLTRGGACEFCKRRKLKCSAEMPQCASCRRANRECVYSQKKQRSRMKLLEDKLAELESRLATRDTGIGSSAAASHPSNDSYGTFLPSAQDHSNAPSAGVELSFLGLGGEAELTLADVPHIPMSADEAKRAEPDLMTLADAAAAEPNERWPWDGMSPQSIAAELVGAVVENAKGMGEKIFLHLLNLFVHSEALRLIHCLVSPSFLYARLGGQTSHPMPHPALLTALIPVILPISPSATLSNPSTIVAVTDALCPPSRMLAQHALATLDQRALDLVAAATLRSLALATQGRFIDSWNENSAACSLLWACGLGKLGGVGEMFAPPELRSADREERVRREEKVRRVRGKGQIVPPPVDAKDAGERIKLFWSVWMNDRANSIGWNWPCAIDNNEMTTPLPKDDYSNPASLCDNTTLDDFLSGRAPPTPQDGIFSTQVKAMALVYEASRLLDRSPDVATPDKTDHLLRLTKRHMAVLKPFAPRNRDEAVQMAGLNEVWMTGYITLLLLYAKEEIDAPSPYEELEARNRSIDAGLNMCQCLQTAFDAGDTELTGYDLLAPTLWFLTGRAFHHFAKRIEATEPARATELRHKVQFVVEATRKLSKQLKLAEVHAQMLYNVSLDAEVMLGEFPRPDNVDFTEFSV